MVTGLSETMEKECCARTNRHLWGGGGGWEGGQ